LAKERDGVFSFNWRHRREALDAETSIFKEILLILSGLQEEIASEVAELKPVLASIRQHLDRQEHQLKSVLEVLYSLQASLAPQ
jgi:uncharacterized coiled-coil protein SlyX